MTVDLTGRTFGKLTIIGTASNTPPLPPVAGGWWTAECICGHQVTAPAEAFLAYRLTSCGCPTPDQRAELQEQIAASRPPSRWW